MSSTQQIANRLVELCREGKYEQCYDELFAADAQNIEMPAMAEGPLGNASGLAAIRAKGQAWMEAVEEMHGGSVGEPSVAGNWFTVPMSMDVTMKGQPRMQMDEMCLYQVRDGRNVREQFFYDT